jgi:lipopolysaccharide/colanic/teichoic acid biosynthesis glycosyltransferase
VNLPNQGKTSRVLDPLSEPAMPVENAALNEEAFRRELAIERKRTERSKIPFLLMLLESGTHQGSERSGAALDRIVSALLTSSRDTDVVGWYKDRLTVGVMFTGLASTDKSAIANTVLNRLSKTLRDELPFDQFNQVSISLHFFPDDWDHDSSGRPSNPALYPDLANNDKGKRALLIMKRTIDVAGSAALSILCAPLCLLIALAIKASSKGPILFRQTRIGQYGKSFTFYKFRSMYTNNDAAIHREYVTKLIACDVQDPETVVDAGKGIYKLTNDKRVTRVGKFLRRTSLDELPQFLNVLKGDMSLVGPRPPIPYELAAYQTWHRRRLLEVKPGITGLWQVTGRSTVSFDEMVRLDLHYATSWTPWLDIKILLLTPAAMLKGTGAY